MKRKERNEVVPLLAVIATGTTLSGLLLGGDVLTAVGAAMYFLPIYIAFCGIKYF